MYITVSGDGCTSGWQYQGIAVPVLGNNCTPGWNKGMVVPRDGSIRGWLYQGMAVSVDSCTGGWHNIGRLC